MAERCEVCETLLEFGGSTCTACAIDQEIIAQARARLDVRRWRTRGRRISEQVRRLEQVLGPASQPPQSS